MSTAVVEQEKLGGVCVNIGCIPTKALLHSAYIAGLLKESKEFGVEASGVKITLIEALPRILPIEDAEASDTLAKSYRKRGIDVIAGAKVTKAAVGKDKVTLNIEAGGEKKQVTAAAVLMAAGRAVNTETIGLIECCIQPTDLGLIKFDQDSLSTGTGYYAIGDVA